jgi:tetratricopeptide (TPR) repeat protein
LLYLLFVWPDGLQNHPAFFLRRFRKGRTLCFAVQGGMIRSFRSQFGFHKEAMSRLWLAFAVLLLVPATLFGQRDRDTYNPSNQTFEILGQVNATDTNAAVAEVPVRLERFSGGIVDQLSTDTRGRFRFANLQRGYYKVIINTAGFSPAQQDADLTLLFKVYLVFALVRTSSAGALVVDVIDARVPATARTEFNRGREAMASKNLNEAITHFNRAVEIFPEFFEAHVLSGTAHMDLREWQLAEAAFQRALEIRPDNPKVLLALGEALWREKRYEDAERVLLEGLKQEDRNWQGYFTLARLHWDKGEVMKAAPAIGHTLQLKPDFAEAHLLAGNILLKLNQTDRAIVEYEEYVRLAPKGEFVAEARNLIQKLRTPNR